jgi:hypothetical protein
MNAHHNPFRMSRIERIPPQLVNRDALWQQFSQQHGRGALIGPHGSGKTTLMEHLQRDAQQRGWLVRSCFINDTTCVTWSVLSNLLIPLAQQKSAQQIPTQRILICIDGAERISPWLWWRFMRRLPADHALLITSHRAGRLPTLHQHTTSAALLRWCVEYVMPNSTLTSEQAHGLFAQYHGNIRDCLRHLYDSWDSSTHRPGLPTQTAR